MSTDWTRSSNAVILSSKSCVLTCTSEEKTKHNRSNRYQFVSVKLVLYRLPCRLRWHSCRRASWHHKRSAPIWLFACNRKQKAIKTTSADSLANNEMQQRDNVVGWLTLTPDKTLELNGAHAALHRRQVCLIVPRLDLQLHAALGNKSWLYTI